MGVNSSCRSTTPAGPNRFSVITLRLQLQKVYELPECNFSSLKSHIVRLEWTIPHPTRKRLVLAANLPFPCAVTAVSNDNMKFIPQEHHARQYVPRPRRTLPRPLVFHCGPCGVSMSKRRDKFRVHRYITPEGKPRPSCELCGEATASRYLPTNNGPRLHVCEDCRASVERDPETGEWTMTFDLDA